MTTFSSIPSYILGGACVGRGIMALFSPRKEYGHVGLLLEPSRNTNETGAVSPLMYFKGLREISYGLTLMALQWQSNESAVTTFSAILSLVRIGDGLVVWMHGGDELRYKAAGHWITGLGFIGWVIWRWSY
ncbi:hypothetical protein BKA59DRAFT_478853 [Fusarium tricinctum]|jgi:hypothetical protein|uniref:Uncharacterized protein n=1 Tax=Fusarium tricinctum TaxID=61284 RepID=A0A8K0WA92_9HYPO|nr:hypothetical protein BKA59DRAFT_478853 [Fusarium tricinctum]